MSCTSLGCQPQDFELKWILCPSHQSAAKRPIGVRGKGVQFSNDLGFAPQAIAYRASGTKERNFKKRQPEKSNHSRLFASKNHLTIPPTRTPKSATLTLFTISLVFPKTVSSIEGFRR